MYYSKGQLKLAFDAAESWRSSKNKELYANVTDDELDHATRWLAYANPFSGNRSCFGVVTPYANVKEVEGIWDQLQ